MRSRVSLSGSVEPPPRAVEAAWGDEGLPQGPGLWLWEERRSKPEREGRAWRETQALPRGCCHLLEKKQPLPKQLQQSPPHTQDRATNQTNARM